VHWTEADESSVEPDLTLPAFKPLATALVVDDDEDVAYLLRHMLMRDGFVVRTASNGREALAFFKASKPVDIVLLDLMLPYIDGFELITRIREDARWKDVPIVAISGKVTESDVVKALDQGANDYVTKPYNPRELRARIRRQLNLQGRE